MEIIEVGGRPAAYHNGGGDHQSGLPTVVMLHAAGTDHTLWQQQARALAHHGYNVVVPDLPGHGQSEDAPNLETLEDYAQWVLHLLKALSVKNAIIVGHSMGSGIALALATLAPETVSAMALLSTRAQMVVNSELMADTRENPGRASAFISAFGLGSRIHLGGSPLPGTALLQSVQALIDNCPPAVLHRDFNASNRFDGNAHAGKVRCPTLVVSGSEDRMTPPKYGRQLAQAIPGARFDILGGKGHMLPVEAPGEVRNLLLEFFEARSSQAVS